MATARTTPNELKDKLELKLRLKLELQLTPTTAKTTVLNLLDDGIGPHPHDICCPKPIAALQRILHSPVL